MLNMLAWLILGILAGWFGSTGRGFDRNRQVNLGGGSIGAVLGGLVFYRFDIGVALNGSAQINLNALGMAFIGAITVLTIINMLRQGQDRSW